MCRSHFYLNASRFPGRRLFAALAALPLVLPPLVGTVAFIFLVRRDQESSRTAIQNLFGLQNPPWRLRGWPALLLFHTYTMYPFFYVLTGAGLRRIDASLAEAARSFGASKITVLRRVLLPQLTPSLLAAALLTFMTSMASFSAPLLFGGDVRVLTLEIFTARQRGDFVIAITETVILAVISLGALIFFQRYEGTRQICSRGDERRAATAREHRERKGARARHDRRGHLRDRFSVAGGDVVPGEFRARRIVDDTDDAVGLHVRKLPATVRRSLGCGSVLQQLHDVGDRGGGGAVVELLLSSRC